MVAVKRQMKTVMILPLITTVATHITRPASQRRAGACAASNNPPCIIASAIRLALGGVVLLIRSPGTPIIETGYRAKRAHSVPGCRARICKRGRARRHHDAQCAAISRSHVGILRAGFIVVNTNPLYTARELELQLKGSGAEAIIVLENFAKTLEQVIAETNVKHVVVASVGDLLGMVKGAIVNLGRAVGEEDGASLRAAGGHAVQRRTCSSAQSTAAWRCNKQ